MTDNTKLFDYDPDAQPEDQKTIRIGHRDEPHHTYGGRGYGGVGMDDAPVGRDGWLGNPYTVGEHGREECIDLFRDDYYDRLRDDFDFCNAVLAQRGNTIACWCRRTHEEEPACHLDVVKESLDEGYVQWVAREVHDISLTIPMAEEATEPPEEVEE